MFEKIKAKCIFERLFCRPDISKAYALTDPSDSWYATLKKVHDSLAEVQREYNREVVETESFDGLTLRAVTYRCPFPAKATVVCIHGYTSHAEREWAFPALFYLRNGFNVVIPYQRAHGLSDGKYITLGAFEKDDMLRWLDKVGQLYPNLPIVVHGLSMGAGIALQICDSCGDRVKGIIDDAPSFRGLPSLFEAVSHSVRGNSKKICQYLYDIFYDKFGLSADVTVAEQYVKHSVCPILFSAGSMENMERDLKHLQELCPKYSETLILEGCNHGNGMYKQTQVYQDVILNFLRKHCGL